jgi:hypothetical protein
LYVLYARNTVDENIFREYDWEEQLGSAEVEQYRWESKESVLDGELVLGERPDVSEFNEPECPETDDLSPGDSYVGPRQGYKISVNAEGRPFEKTGSGRQFITNDEITDAASIVYQLKSGGSIIINECGHMITRTKEETVYIGETDGPNTFEYEDNSAGEETDDPVEFDDVY